MLLGNRTYNVLKFIAQILLPAVATLYFALAQIWDLPKTQEVVGTITAIDTFLGVMLRISSSSYNSSEAKYDGTFVLEPDPEHGVSNLRLSQVDYEALQTKNELTFKLQR